MPSKMIAQINGKTDMDRVGVFSEMPYITIGDNYKAPQDCVVNESAYKGRQLLSSTTRVKAATADGYFDKFSRVFDGESFSDPIRRHRLERREAAKKNLGKTFVPSSGEKDMNGQGTNFGTFSGPVPALSAVAKPFGGDRETKHNFYTNPGKKGTGFGYLGVTLGDYPKYMSDQYDSDQWKKEHDRNKELMKGTAFRLGMHPRDTFDTNPYGSNKPLPPMKTVKSAPSSAGSKAFRPSHPGKKLGGMKAGCFETFPTHSGGLYGRSPSKEADKGESKKFVPNSGFKSKPTTSILAQNVCRSINSQNFRKMHSFHVYT